MVLITIVITDHEILLFVYYYVFLYTYIINYAYNKQLPMSHRIYSKIMFYKSNSVYYITYNHKENDWALSKYNILYCNYTMVIIVLFCIKLLLSTQIKQTSPSLMPGQIYRYCSNHFSIVPILMSLFYYFFCFCFRGKNIQSF